jgi:arginase family enzyme
MTNVLAIFERVIGKRSRHSAPPSSGLAALSRRSTSDPVVFEPQGPKLRMILVDDIDPETGRVFPDYLERREARRQAEERPARGAVVIGGDHSPL